MIPKELNDWLQAAGLFGVFAGLILVAYEINQSSQQLELSASADGVDNFTQAMEALAQDDDLSRLIYRAEKSFDELDEFDRWRISKYLDGYMSMSEQDFLVMRAVEGFQGNTAFLNDWRENMELQMYREYWSHSQDRYTSEFQALIGDILTDLSGGE